MLDKTRGFILRSLKYGDTSVIAHIFTEKYGRKSFIFKGIRSSKSKNKANLIQPLQLLNLDFYYKEHKDLLISKEFSRACVYSDFPYNHVKSAQAMLLAEVLDKCLQEEMRNEELFEFLENSIEYFDLKKEDYSNFHLSFLMKITKYLGILPKKSLESKEVFFDLLEGSFITEKPLHNNYSESKLSQQLLRLFEDNFEEGSKLRIGGDTRNLLLKIILRYYSIHNYKLENLKSKDILIEVFRQ